MIRWHHMDEAPRDGRTILLAVPSATTPDGWNFYLAEWRVWKDGSAMWDCGDEFIKDSDAYAWGAIQAPGETVWMGDSRVDAYLRGKDNPAMNKIKIKKANKGALHRDMGVPEGSPIPVGKIRAKLARDKASGNTKGVKRDVFAINAKTKFNQG